MSFKTHCSFCHQKVKAEDGWEGLQAECPNCSKIFIIMKETPLKGLPGINIQLNNENQFTKGWNNQVYTPVETYYSAGENNYIPNHMTKAVIAILFFFWPLGLVSFYWATQVNNLKIQKNWEGALRASHNAEVWFFLSLAVFPLVILAAVCAALLC